MARKPKSRPKSRPRNRKVATAPERVRHLIALDAANVMRRIAARQGEMLALFSRLRDRTPMIETVHSWFDSAGFPELSLLDPGEQAVVNGFYEELGELRWYFEYTEDMPNTVQTTISARLKRLGEAHATLVGVIGEPVGHAAPAVVAQVVVHDVTPEPPALPSTDEPKRGAR